MNLKSEVSLILRTVGSINLRALLSYLSYSFLYIYKILLKENTMEFPKLHLLAIFLFFDTSYYN
jgi:hypothetical protein